MIPRRTHLFQHAPPMLLGFGVAFATMAALNIIMGMAGLFDGPKHSMARLISIGGGIVVGGIATWHTRSLRHLRQDAALGTRCGKCGYDLRATECRCPECGEYIPLPLQRDN